MLTQTDDNSSSIRSKTHEEVEEELDEDRPTMPGSLADPEYDSLDEELEEEGDENLPTMPESLADVEEEDTRRRDIAFIKEFLSKHGIEADLVDVAE